MHGSRAVTTQPLFPRLQVALVVVLIAALALCVSGEVPAGKPVLIEYPKQSKSLHPSFQKCVFRDRKPRVYRPMQPGNSWPSGQADDTTDGSKEENFQLHGPFSGDYKVARPYRPPYVFEISLNPIFLGGEEQTIYRRCCWQYITHEMDLRTATMFCEREDPVLQDNASNRDETPLQTANHELPPIPHDQVPAEPKKRSKVSRLLDRLPGRRAAADHDVPPPTDNLNPTKQESNEISTKSPPRHNWKDGLPGGHRLNGDFAFEMTRQPCVFRSNFPRVYHPNPDSGLFQGGGELGDDATPASSYPDWANYGPFSPAFAENQASAELRQRRPGPRVWKITNVSKQQIEERCCWQHITNGDFKYQMVFCEREELGPAVNAASIPDVNAPPQPTAHPAAKQQKNIFGASLLRDLKKK